MFSIVGNYFLFYSKRTPITTDFLPPLSAQVIYVSTENDTIYILKAKDIWQRLVDLIQNFTEAKGIQCNSVNENRDKLRIFMEGEGYFVPLCIFQKDLF